MYLNRHSSFVWEGLDGSSVLSHMPPADTYNAQAFPEEVLRSANKNKDSGVINSSMMLVGHGDGGGGASPAMLESMRRMKDVDGIPKVKFSSPQTFFKELEDRKEEVPRWVGELYFELHRGTFTTQADTKKNNRQCENLLRDVELLSTHGVIAGICGGQAFQYPSELLDKSWKVVLKNCFHDTLPGSCIGMVYEETKRDYDFVKQTCMQLITKAFDWLGRVNSTQLGDGRCEENGNALENACTSADNGKSEENESEYVNVEGMLFVRGTGWERSDGRPYVMEMESSKAGVLGSKVVAQCSKSGAMTSWPKMCMSEKDVDYTIVALRKKASGMGIIYKPEFVGISKNVEVVSPVSISKCISEGGETEYLLANRLVKARISSSGRLTSLVLCCGKQEREAVSYGQKVDGKWCSGGNRLVMYDDVSQFWCGWDTEVYSFEKAYDIEGANVCEIVDEGPLQVSVGVKYAGTKAGSTIEQFIVLRAESARLDFRTYVDWKESRKILRVLFDTQVRSSYASYDCQFGHVRRTTRFNNSWDIAKFEVVGHQYCDLSEHKFGVALLNDCKYGYSVRDSTMRLSLLRASKSPDEMADVGQHRFTYSILAHWGSFPTRVVLEEAGDLNWPPIFRGVNGEMKGIESKFVLVSGEDGTGLDTAVISSVKRAEGDEGVVVRVYEAMGARGSARLQCPQGMGVSDVFECTMLEDRKERSDISYSEGRNNKSKVEVLMPLTPFQIRTVKIML